MISDFKRDVKPFKCMRLELNQAFC